MKKPDGKYILLISIHGLIRSRQLELGRDADTGGQTKYVLDLATALAGHASVGQVDLVTRLIPDPAVSKDYRQPVEYINPAARIIRIAAGPDDYLAKEQLWDYLDSFMDNLVNWLNQQPRKPDVIHTHYADAGYVGIRLSHLFGIPLVHTGHSLGRDKRKQLLAKGLTREQIESTYNIARRIDAEEDVLANADLVITSTHNEIEEQYALYNYYEPERMRVIPPGTSLQQFYPPAEAERHPFKKHIEHFLKEPDKPMVLALSRPDERKNILILIEAFGENPRLREKANLLIVAGTRDDIRDLESGARSVFENILLLIDQYDLYGSVAIPKKHSADDVPAIYRMVAAGRGVFINPALTEPFGLTILEAAASGLPVVATENGGPVDIINNCGCGCLVNPLDRQEIARALLNYLDDEEAWRIASCNGIEGVTRHYSWQAHVDTYLAQLDGLDKSGQLQPLKKSQRKTVYHRQRAIFSDLDQNLVGDEVSLRAFREVIRDNRKCVSFGIATGRRIDSALSLIRKHAIPTPDILISSLGTRIHYGRNLTEDDAWTNHIDHAWAPVRTRRLIDNLPGLKKQAKSEQGDFKLSWYYDEKHAPSAQEIIDLMRQHEITANLFLSFGQFLDIVPARASKGQALRFVAQRLEIPLENTLVAGGSGADEDMMRGNPMAVVVANRHHEELSQLDTRDRIYFADRPHAAGILEAIDHFDFFNACFPEHAEHD